MIRNCRILIFISLSIVMVAKGGFAQDPSGEVTDLDVIKYDMSSAARTSVNLADENKALRSELINLQLEIEKLEQEISLLDPDYVSALEKKRQQGEGESSVLHDADNDDLIREAQNIYLSGQTMMIDDLQRLRELRLYELQYQKQELELELKSLEFLKKKVDERQRPAMAAMEQEIKNNRVQLRKVAEQVARQESDALMYPQKIELLKMENKALKERISQIKKSLK